jgi:hypothetical protein
MEVLQQHGINVEQTKNFVTVVLWEKHIGRASELGQPDQAKLENRLTQICGPMTETSVGGARYYVCFKYDYSEFHHVFITTTKGEVADCLRQFLQEVKTAGHVTKVLLSDNGKGFNCEAVQKVLKEHGIMHRLIIPYTPEQNAAAEQENRTTVESAHSLLHSGGLPKEQWAEACNTTVYILNHTGPTPVEGKTPLELSTGSYATLGHLHAFGTECYVHIPKQKRHKWDQKSKLGRLVGYMGEKDGYQIWISNEKKMVFSRDVFFKPEVVGNLHSNITKTESMCPKLHVTPSQEIQVLQNHKSDDENNVSTSGGSNESNSKKYVQDGKSVCEKKQPNWMTSGEFVCLVDDSQVDYCLTPISYTEAMEKAGLQNSTADPCLFYGTHEDSFLYIAIYVDDGLVVGNKDEEIEVFFRATARGI